MNKENILLSCKTIEMSETKTYLELLNRVCYYDAPNLNNVELPSNTALEKAQSLIDMPVKAKYTVNSKGEPTFKGHEAYISKDGELAFDTDNIGVHTDVYIQDDDVEIKGEVKRLPCLFAKQKIWTRNRNVVAACKRLFAEGKLHNSWEIISENYQFDHGVKRLTDYVFEANTFLGYDVGVDPAFGNSAKVISLSSNCSDGELLIAEALSKDKIEDTKQESEVNSLGNKEKINEEQLRVNTQDAGNLVVEEPEDIDPVPETPVDDESAKKRSKCEVEQNGDTDKLRSTIEVLNQTIAEKNSDIIEMGKEISALKKVIDALEPFKEAYEKAEAEKAEAEKDAKIAELKNYVKDANAFSDDELNSDEIKNLISELNKPRLQEMIADRLVSNFRSNLVKVPVETSSTHKIDVQPDVVDDVQIDMKSIMSNFLK